VGTILTGVNPMDLLCYQNIAILAKKKLFGTTKLCYHYQKPISVCTL